MPRAVIADLAAHDVVNAVGARLGIDRWDELWDGDLHMAPPPSGRHQRLGTELFAALAPYETGVYRSSEDYRVPDLTVYLPAVASGRGIDGAPALVVEIGVPEVLVVERDHPAAALHTRDGVGTLPVELGVTVTRSPDGLDLIGPAGERLPVRPA
jgi:hypothetical protein